MLDNKIRRFYR